MRQLRCSVEPPNEHSAADDALHDPIKHLRLFFALKYRLPFQTKEGKKKSTPKHDNPLTPRESHISLGRNRILTHFTFYLPKMIGNRPISLQHRRFETLECIALVDDVVFGKGA